MEQIITIGNDSEKPLFTFKPHRNFQQRNRYNIRSPTDNVDNIGKYFGKISKPSKEHHPWIESSKLSDPLYEDRFYDGTCKRKKKCITFKLPIPDSLIQLGRKEEIITIPLTEEEISALFNRQPASSEDASQMEVEDAPQMEFEDRVVYDVEETMNFSPKSISGDGDLSSYIDDDTSPFFYLHRYILPLW